MTSPSSIPKRTSPVPHNGPPVSGNYSNLNSLPPILSSDSIDDEIVSPLESSHTEISIIKENDESHCVHHESDEDEALNVRESETGEEHNLGTKKLLSQQESSEPINMRQSSKKKSTGFLCCLSPGSTTDAVIRQDVPSDTQRSNTRSSQQDTSKTVKKSQKHQEVNASRGKSHGESKSLDTSVGKSSSSHGKKQPGSVKKSKSSSNSQNDLSSNPQHGTTKRRNPEGESKPAWLN